MTRQEHVAQEFIAWRDRFISGVEVPLEPIKRLGERQHVVFEARPQEPKGKSA